MFVSIDTTMFFNNYHYRNVNDFVFSYFDKNTDAFRGMEQDEFEREFDSDRAVFEEYMNSLPSEFQNMDAVEEENLRLYLKALIAQQLFDVNAYFKIINTQDKMLEKVIELDEQGYPLDP